MPPVAASAAGWVLTLAFCLPIWTRPPFWLISKQGCLDLKSKRWSASENLPCDWAGFDVY